MVRSYSESKLLGLIALGEQALGPGARPLGSALGAHFFAAYRLALRLLEVAQHHVCRLERKSIKPEEAAVNKAVHMRLVTEMCWCGGWRVVGWEAG